MKDLIKLHGRPKLNSPVMLASWPGIGDVSLIVATYLRRNLDFKDLAEIDPSYFFDPIGIIARDNIVEDPQFPESKFYYWKNQGGGNDIILFIGEDQPFAKGYELAHCVLDIGDRFQVKRVYTCAAALSQMHHTEPPRVWGVVTSPHLTGELEQYDLVQRRNLQISGLNGLLLGVAKERGFEGICLLGEVPMHATRIQNPMAALAVLQVLTRMLSIEVDVAELAQVAQETAERMKQIAAEAMEEYIDQFTRPIWEYGEESEEDEEED